MASFFDLFTDKKLSLLPPDLVFDLPLNLNQQVNLNDSKDQFEYDDELDYDDEDAKDLFIKHEYLYDISKIELYNENENIKKLFLTITALLDPYTQPSSTGVNNEYILSLEFISNLVILLNKPEQGHTWFDLCMNLSKIVERVSIILNCYDEYQIPDINEIDNKNSLSQLSNWTPLKTVYESQLPSGCHDLKLLYSIVGILIFTIGNIYFNYLHIKNVSLNPFLSIFLKYWKIHTSIIILGLEYDRYCEDNKIEFATDEYPEIIRYVIKGSAMVRNVLLIILNEDFSVREHDIKHESFLNFCSPWGRKGSTGGALRCDLRLLISLMLSLGFELLEVTNLLICLDPDDKYDHDIAYIFDYELDDDEEIDGNDSDQDNDQGNGIEDGHHEAAISDDEIIYDIHPDCHCKFDNDTLDFKDDDYIEDDMVVNAPVVGDVSFKYRDETLLNSDKNEVIDDPEVIESLRQKLINEFISEINPDQMEDWRDIPRGENEKFSKDFEKLLTQPKTSFYQSWDEIKKIIATMNTEVIPKKTGDKLVMTLLSLVLSEAQTTLKDKPRAKITPDMFYLAITKNSDFFNLIITLNQKIVLSILDELFMCAGFRRTLIWYLTHSVLNLLIIQYFFDLIMGNRTVVSRCGPLVLSRVEKSMLLHEFISNAAVYLSRGTFWGVTKEIPWYIALEVARRIELESKDPEESKPSDPYERLASPSVLKNLIEVICIVLKRFYENGVLVKGDEEYRDELQVLLLQWVVVSDDARELFEMCS